MPVYTTSEHTDMILLLGECRGNQRAAAQLYRRRYPNRRHPSSATFWRLAKNLRSYGRFRKPSVPSEDAQRQRAERDTAVVAAMHAYPHASTRRLARDAGLSQATVLNILHRHKLHPYRIHLHQALHGDDGMRRVYYCLAMKELIREIPDFLSHILYSDEATFHQDGSVNRHNMRYWSDTNPHWLREQHHQVRWKLNVWCGIHGDRIVGPYFLPPTLNGPRYLRFLEDTLDEDYLSRLPLRALRQLWFQQDGAPAHNGAHVHVWLNRTFGRSWMGTHGPVRWPARSPDLTPLDFFLWGFVKAQVYGTPPNDVQDLMNRIRAAVALITPAMLRSVRAEIGDRLEECITADGWHFEHLQ